MAMQRLDGAGATPMLLCVDPAIFRAAMGRRVRVAFLSSDGVCQACGGTTELIRHHAMSERSPPLKFWVFGGLVLLRALRRLQGHGNLSFFLACCRFGFWRFLDFFCDTSEVCRSRFVYFSFLLLHLFLSSLLSEAFPATEESSAGSLPKEEHW